MKKWWKVEYAFRKDGKYVEDTMYVFEMYVSGAISKANAFLNKKASDDHWDSKSNGHYHDRFVIWDVGIIGDAEEEVI